MDIHGYPWISIDIHGYPSISMDIHRYPWTPIDIYLISQVCVFAWSWIIYIRLLRVVGGVAASLIEKAEIIKIIYDKGPIRRGGWGGLDPFSKIEIFSFSGWSL